MGGYNKRLLRSEFGEGDAEKDDAQLAQKRRVDVGFRFGGGGRERKVGFVGEKRFWWNRVYWDLFRSISAKPEQTKKKKKKDGASSNSVEEKARRPTSNGNVNAPLRCKNPARAQGA
jgi:hypothetical protein